MHSETPLTHSETKQKHVTTTKSDLSSSAKRRAGLDAMESHLPARRITTPRHKTRRRRRAAQHDGPLARNHASRPPLTAVVPQQMQRKLDRVAFAARVKKRKGLHCVEK
jgi:hypothetical protein